MRFSIASTLALYVGVATAASNWGFTDGKVEVLSRSSDSTSAHAFSDKEPLISALTLGQGEKIKISLTTKDGSKAKRPHQAFLNIREASGLEAPFPLTIKESGKGTVEIAQKDLPVQLLLSKAPLSASLVLGSFGSTQGTVTTVFDIVVVLDPSHPIPPYETPLRYGKQPEIYHIYRADPKNPPVVVSLVFALAVVVTVPALLLGWTFFGANLSNLPKSLSNAPISHTTFFGSIAALEGIFVLYYSGTKLLSILPIVGVVSVIAFLSGTKALGEVQRRRLSGDT